MKVLEASLDAGEGRLYEGGGHGPGDGVLTLHVFVALGVRNYSLFVGPLTIMVLVDATKIWRYTAIVLKNETEYAEYVEAREAARMLGMSQRAIRNLVASGRLETKRDGEGAAVRLVVSTASIERLRSER